MKTNPLPARVTLPLLSIVLLTGALAAPCSAQRVIAEPADDWTELFHRTSGWTGADGTHSISLNGRNWFGQGEGGTLFLFSDTFIGDVVNNERQPGTRLIYNSAALLRGTEPREDRLTFHWGEDNGEPAPLVVPSTPNSEPGDWLWAMDGAVIDRVMRLFTLHLRRGNEGWFTVGVIMLSIPLDSPQPFRDMWQMDMPLHHVPDPPRGTIFFGPGILVNTEEAGAPHPDGWVYLYGGQHDFIDKKLVVARIRPDEIEDPNAWEFWDGEEWQEDIDRLGILFNGSAGGASVVPLPDGRYIFVYQGWGFLANVIVRFGDTPIGPFSRKHIVYQAPERVADPDLIIYGTRTHTHLSKPGELLISYNVNAAGDFWRLFREADIYRPRFVRLRIE